MAFGREIGRLRKVHHVSAKVLADAIGIDHERLRSWEKQDLNPRETDTALIEKYFGMPISELMKLEQLPKVPTREEAKAAHIARREYFREVGDEKNGIMVYESAPTYASMKTVYHDDPDHMVPDYVLRIPQFRDCNYGTRASGDSMYPEVRNGDLVICKELSVDARIIFGDMYVVHTKDGIETIKYIQQFVDDEDKSQVLLVPHNRAAGMGTPIPRNEIVRLFKVRAIFKAY